MGRAKITMEPINNDKKRKITFNTRKQGLIKKARELTTLCDINLSMIICADDQENLEIFPPDCKKLNSLIDLYKHNLGMDPQKINFYAISDYLNDRKTKIEEQLVKAKKKSLETKYPLWFDFLDNASESQLKQFAFGLEKKIIDVKTRIESIKNFVVDPVGFYSADDNLMMQSWNPNPVNSTMNAMIMPSSYPNSLMNMMIQENNNVVYDSVNFSLQPSLMEHWCQPELMQQHFDSDFISQVKNTRGDGSEIISNYLL